MISYRLKYNIYQYFSNTGIPRIPILISERVECTVFSLHLHIYSTEQNAIKINYNIFKRLNDLNKKQFLCHLGITTSIGIKMHEELAWT